jgi:stage II sporulation protein D
MKLKRSWSSGSREIEQLRGWATAAILGIFSISAGASSNLPLKIAVGLADHQREALIESSAPLTIQENLHSVSLVRVGRIHLKISGRSLVGDGRRFPGDLVVQPGRGSFLRYRGRPYRGTIQVRRLGSERIQVINHVGLEDYLAGVLPLENPPQWDLETLKAQAVVCRTFAVSSLQRHGADGFDVCPLTHCQVYRGASAEDPRTSQAVSQTAGEIMTYDRKPIEAYFHDDCGGMTESAEDVWGGRGNHLPYLNRVRCPSHKTWGAIITANDISRALQSPGVTASDVKNLRVSSRTHSGRARTIVVSTRRHGDIALSANTFRLRLGADTIKSTFWARVHRRGSRWEIRGTGWGHGVGLCQCGAERLGERGWNYRRILAHYFQGISVEHRTP